MSGRIPLRRRLTRRGVLVAAALALVGTALALGPKLLGDRDRYVPGEKVEGITNELERTGRADESIRFVDVTREAGVDFVHFAGGRRSAQLPEDVGSGVAWGDFDDDGDPDLFVVDFAGPLAGGDAAPAGPGGCRLYRNDGGGHFTDVTAAAGIGWVGPALGALWFDGDGDGRDDLLLTTFGRIVYFHNDGGGRFSDQSKAAGFAAADGFWTGAAAADPDGDGDLDVYVCGYVKYRFREEDRTATAPQYGEETPFTINPSSYPPERNLFFRNRGGGRFEEAAEELGISNPEGRSFSAVWSDFDDDGRVDLYVANDVSDNVLYRNTGDGLFEDVSHPAQVADYRGAMGLATGDADGDGAIDLFITHWIAQENGFYRNATAAGERLRFDDVADRVGLGQSTLDFIGWGTVFEDFDADGWLDLYMANGSTFQDRADPSKLVAMSDQLFRWSPREGRYVDVAPLPGGARLAPEVGRGVAAADFDADGKVDLAVSRNGGPARLLRNVSPGPATLALQLEQPGPNKRALGARIEVDAGGRRLVREVGAGGSYLGHSWVGQAIGTGGAAVTEVRVRWPDRTVESFGPRTPGRHLLRRGEGKGVGK